MPGLPLKRENKKAPKNPQIRDRRGADRGLKNERIIVTLN
jgi:hypothetical protein